MKPHVSQVSVLSKLRKKAKETSNEKYISKDDFVDGVYAIFSTKGDYTTASGARGSFKKFISDKVLLLKEGPTGIEIVRVVEKCALPSGTVVMNALEDMSGDIGIMDNFTTKIPKKGGQPYPCWDIAFSEGDIDAIVDELKK